MEESKQGGSCLSHYINNTQVFDSLFEYFEDNEELIDNLD